LKSAKTVRSAEPLLALTSTTCDLLRWQIKIWVQKLGILEPLQNTMPRIIEGVCRKLQKWY